jgi:riboflavin kinase/FMN adenylyltransferase
VLPGQSDQRTATPETLPDAWRGGVVAIGNFDGVHRGHQAVLLAALEEADRLKRPCIMLTFEPHPRTFFSGRPLFRLTPGPLKSALGAALGLDGMLVFPFDRGLAEMSAEDFVREILVERLAIRSAVTGYDFHFGKARRGTPQFLAGQGALNGFSVTIVGALEEGGTAVSATRIRAALAQGDVEDAARMLGWHFAVTGEVVHGEKRGRELGYPTANIRLDPANELMHGIYAVRLVGRDGVLRDGVASYGRRPTFGGGAPLLETFVFDFSGDLYGEEVLVALYGFIRPELKFDGIAELVARMDQDCIDARVILERVPAGELDLRLYQIVGNA